MRPVLLAVDDDPEVLRAVDRDLRRRYADKYRVVRAESGASAINALRTFGERGDPIAMVVADQRMPEMTGVELLQQTLRLVPDAKRVLLTAYADTDAAIDAINKARIDNYLLKPWDPPEEKLYTVLDDLLDDWQSSYQAPFEGIRVIGHRWSPKSHDVRDFLGRNLVPFKWLDLDVSEEARTALSKLSTGTDAPALPVVVFPDGDVLAAPEPSALGARLGLRSRAEKPFYDLVVVGGGPAGLAAAVYGASEGLRTLLLEREAPGGQAGTSSRIENYLGFPSGLTGADLTRRAVAQARKFGAELLTPQEACRLRIDGQYRVITLSDGSDVSTRALLISSGVSYRTLDVPGAEKLTGAGIYYGAALTEAISCRDEGVLIIGGGNSAGQAALFFAQYARHVAVLVRGASLGESMSQYLVDQVEATPNVTVMTRTRLTAVHGDDRLHSVTVTCGSDERELEATSLFAFIGAVPRTEWVAGVIERDEHGFIRTGPDLPQENGRPRGWPLARDPYLLETNVPGVFCAGDVRHQSVKRVASAVGEGSIAVQFTHRYLAEG
ncbi:MAG TPA: FAD-dependent oxidoreductase [Gemmatimonadaceae bacterium]|jgi:thioredoxin reductase (NADPH)